MERKSWFVRQAESEAKKDVMPMSERMGSIVAVIGAVILIMFFVLHQIWATGFFTSLFGSAFFTLYTAILYTYVQQELKNRSKAR